MDSMIEQIKAICLKHAKADDYCEDIYGNSGGNYDDAYSIGVDYGYSGLAKDILKLIESAVPQQADNMEEK